MRPVLEYRRVTISSLHLEGLILQGAEHLQLPLKSMGILPVGADARNFPKHSKALGTCNEKKVSLYYYSTLMGPNPPGKCSLQELLPTTPFRLFVPPLRSYSAIKPISITSPNKSAVVGHCQTASPCMAAPASNPGCGLQPVRNVCKCPAPLPAQPEAVTLMPAALA